MRASRILAVTGGTAFAASGGLAAAAVISKQAAPAPVKTVTVNLSPGPEGTPGPAGPTGPKGDQGPPGSATSFECLTGFVPGILVINQPGGHVDIYTCIAE